MQTIPLQTQKLCDLRESNKNLLRNKDDTRSPGDLGDGDTANRQEILTELNHCN